MYRFSSICQWLWHKICDLCTFNKSIDKEIAKHLNAYRGTDKTYWWPDESEKHKFLMPNAVCFPSDAAKEEFRSKLAELLQINKDKVTLDLFDTRDIDYHPQPFHIEADFTILQRDWSCRKITRLRKLKQVIILFMSCVFPYNHMKDGTCVQIIATQFFIKL